MTAFYLSKAYDPPQAPQKLPLDRPWALLGGNSPQQFMKSYWQKKPLLVRGAIPAFELAKQIGDPLGCSISPKELFEIAGDDAVESRLIKANPWAFSNGPFKKKTIPSIETTDWTLLIQGMEAKHPAAAKVLSWFRFIPDARLDDLMISIAGPGGGVGPHFDSYDVFLIQMSGRRRWRISEQKDLTLNPNLPLKILQDFRVEQEWDLEPGDMLYLPPHVAHDGIALDAGCQTWSVGFRSQSYKEILQEGLWRLAESLEDIPGLNKHFTDPKQAATHCAEQLPDEIIVQVAQKLKDLKLDRVETFLPGIAAYLSEPKPQAFFDGLANELSPEQFRHQLNQQSLHAHPYTRLLALGTRIYCNGEEMTDGQNASTQAAWRSLASSKQFTGSLEKIGLNNSLFEAFEAGWLLF
ncbi:cupin domain-containing protein [Polynucleobacter sp. JS-Mosq-20-D10]|uniref:cupin domain-containing protein n=1 Tax=Polynucleobacter sp. JS-Mosq-20-D10 TaxID=2576922 RepID=UPI001BFE09F1|nr:cupin domain-containing protein [Polynucleobacter sp. JS-Mosq-20-D10]QWE01370.1 cupin domain-containing protein [Polynucleobacter sp. JS-Mosq-20-D10]